MGFPKRRLSVSRWSPATRGPGYPCIPQRESAERRGHREEVDQTGRKDLEQEHGGAEDPNPPGKGESGECRGRDGEGGMREAPAGTTVPMLGGSPPPLPIPGAGMQGQGQGDGFYLPICRPGQGRALGRLRFAAGADHLLLELIHDDFPFQILQEERGRNEGSWPGAPDPAPDPARGALRNSLWVSTRRHSDGIKGFITARPRKRGVPNGIPSGWRRGHTQILMLGPVAAQSQ